MLSEVQGEYLDQKEDYLDSFIDKDDEHLLFVSSYIHGHFSVVAANLSQLLGGTTAGAKLSAENMSDSQLEETLALAKSDLNAFAKLFESLLYQNIEQAIANNELSDSDAKAVLIMLKTLFDE